MISPREIPARRRWLAVLNHWMENWMAAFPAPAEDNGLTVEVMRIGL